MVTIYNKIVIDMCTMQTVYAESFDYTGRLALCDGSGSGGGGSSGKVDYPVHMKNMHIQWLYDPTTITPASGTLGYEMDAAKTAQGGNPYTNAYAYDPTTGLEDVQDRYDKFNTAVAKLDVFTDWHKIVEEAQDGLQATVLSDSEVEDAVTQFEIEQRLPYNRSVARFNAGMADINATMGSAFVVGNALLDTELLRAVAKFREDLTLQNQKQKFLFTLQSVGEMSKLLLSKVSFGQAATHLLGEINRVKAVLQTEYLTSDLDISTKDATWDMTLYQYGANLLASIGGGVVSPGVERQPSVARSAVGGALSGASAGAYVGGKVSDADSASTIGAGIGAALGIGSAFL